MTTPDEHADADGGERTAEPDLSVAIDAESDPVEVALTDVDASDSDGASDGGLDEATASRCGLWLGDD